MVSFLRAIRLKILRLENSLVYLSMELDPILLIPNNASRILTEHTWSWILDQLV